MKIVELDSRGNAINALTIAAEPIIAVARGLGDHMQRMPYSVPDLVISVSNMMKIHQHEVEKSRTFVGRILGKLIKPVDPDTMKIDGMRLSQCFQANGIEPPVGIHVGKDYLVDVVSLRAMVERLEGGLAE